MPAVLARRATGIVGPDAVLLTRRFQECMGRLRKKKDCQHDSEAAPASAGFKGQDKERINKQTEGERSNDVREGPTTVIKAQHMVGMMQHSKYHKAA